MCFLFKFESERIDFYVNYFLLPIESRNANESFVACNSSNEHICEIFSRLISNVSVH